MDHDPSMDEDGWLGHRHNRRAYAERNLTIWVAEGTLQDQRFQRLPAEVERPTRCTHPASPRPPMVGIHHTKSETGSPFLDPRQPGHHRRGASESSVRG